MDDQIEAAEVLHNEDSEDLHFRFIGMARNRQFIVNVQFAFREAGTPEKLTPVEYDFVILKILGLVTAHIRSRPNPSLN